MLLRFNGGIEKPKAMRRDAMQVEMKDFNPVYVERLLAVSRVYFCADLASVANERKHRAGVTRPIPPQPALRQQCTLPSV